ncbi:MAG: erythromycin esterase family protein, partial [Sarcina sp.]|nr:erythromycin esterase family protein [Sarcina sp.]
MGTCGKNGKNRTAEGVVEISKNPTDTTRRNKMKDMGIKKKKHVAIRRIVILCILAVLVLTGTVFSHFGGFGTGESADPKEFAAYAGQISEIAIPDNTRIIALGEATHGNREFQQLKLDVFQIMVEQYGVRAFALEGDYGGCEAVNRYIHGGDGTAKEAAAAIGFAIYRTDEMEDLISWMRSYNETAAEGDDIRFYGFDMQQTEYNYQFLLEELKSLGHDTAELEILRDGEEWSALYNREERVSFLTKLNQELSERNLASDTDQAMDTAVHLTDILLQNQAMEKAYEENFADANGIRDQYMADNTMWILAQEEKRGNDRIFITGHNGHMEQSGTYVGGENKVMGNLLTDRIGRNAYFAIGTDFYKTTCNFPTSSGKRVNRTFYSRDP